MSSNFTPEQSEVINHGEGGLMVTASAGSGKTRVMVERFVKLIIEGKASVKEVLAVTFTRLAAGELKDRLKKALCEEIRKGKDVKRLKEQLDDLPVADVCTIDSFCAAIVRKYFYVVGVSPSFTVLDPAEAEAIKDKAADETFERLYEENDEDMLLLLKVFSRRRSDKAVKTRILSLYNFSDSEKDGISFFEKFVENYTPEGVKRVENELIALYYNKFKALTQPFFVLRSRCFELLMSKSTEYCSDIISYLNVLSENLNPEGMEIYLSADRTKPREVCKDEVKRVVNEDIKTAKDRLIKTVNEARNVFLDGKKYEKAISSLPIAKALVKVLKEFEKTYSTMKKEAGALDYGDLERFCYRVLCDDASREEIACGYKYVFVDEYQDVNDVQQAIFEKVDRDNTFIVGDAKQSIYGFRGSDSDIFIRRLRLHEAEGNKVVNLSKNFRSTKGVLCCVNNVFAEIMTQESAGTNYSAEPMLYGNLYGDEVGGAEILRFVDESDEEKKEEYGVYGVAKHLEKLRENKSRGEERLVRYVIEKTCGTEIYDPSLNTKRPLTFGDIAVLTRTNTGLADRITKELTRCGIPVVSDSKRSIGEYPEIDLIVNVLKTVSTAGRDDIALASALKSPVGNLSDEDLYAVRKADAIREDSFYEACVKYSSDDETEKKLKKFFDYLTEVRLYASFETAAATLRKIFADTQFDLYLLSKPLGKLKLKRAERFIAECEKSSLTVEGFLSRADELLKNMTISVSEGEEAVKVMSIHASKGLEFPVVILTELDRSMLSVDKRDEIICDRKAGIGLKFYDFETKKSGSNLVRDYVGFLRSEATKRDEMRLLYVAMTRAEHRLFMIVKSKPVHERMGAETAYAGKMSAFLSQQDCKYTEISSEDIPQEIDFSSETKIILDKPKEADKRLIDKFLRYKYPFEDDTTLCLKKTVTEINTENKSDETLNEGLKITEKEYFSDELPVQTIFEAKTVLEGNAYHRFMQYVNFEKNVEEELSRLTDEGVLTKEEVEIIDVEKLNKIFAHPLIVELKDYKLYREQPFIVYVDASLAGEKGDGKVLVQGVIDLLAVKENSAVIVDYKFSSKGDEKLSETYEKQINLYAYAVENALKLKVEGKYLFNLNKIRTVRIK